MNSEVITLARNDDDDDDDDDADDDENIDRSSVSKFIMGFLL